jgi:hypothetical protein
MACTLEKCLSESDSYMKWWWPLGLHLSCQLLSSYANEVVLPLVICRVRTSIQELACNQMYQWSTACLVWVDHSFWCNLRTWGMWWETWRVESKSGLVSIWVYLEKLLRNTERVCDSAGLDECWPIWCGCTKENWRSNSTGGYLRMSCISWGPSMSGLSLVVCLSTYSSLTLFLWKCDSSLSWLFCKMQMTGLSHKSVSKK